MQFPSLFPLLFETTLRMHCIYSRQLEFGTMSQSPNGLDTFWSHRLPRRHSLVHSHSDILITRTTSFISIWENHSLRCPPQWVPPFHFPLFANLPTRRVQSAFPGLLSCCLGVGQAALRSCPPHSHHLPCAPNPLRFPQHQERAADGYIVKFSYASSIAASLMGHPSPTFSTACLAQPLHSPR